MVASRWATVAPAPLRARAFRRPPPRRARSSSARYPVDEATRNMARHPWKFKTEEVSANVLVHSGFRINGASFQFTETEENIIRLLSEAVAVELKITPNSGEAI